MPVPFAVPPLLTTAGRYAVPYLIREFAKKGSEKFSTTYGTAALESINNIGAQNPELFNEEFKRYTNDIDEGKEEETTGTELSTEVKEEPPKLPEEPPKGPDIGTELATEAAVQTTKKLLEDKKPDVSKQTKDLVPEKPKFGKLSKVEKETALALKGDKPDFYSRAVDAIKNAKQDKFTKGKWKSIIQSNSTKNEMDYLGLTEILKGNESTTKQELLSFVEGKDITSGITVKSIPRDQMNIMYADYSLGGNEDTKGNLTDEHIVFQLGVDDSNVGEMFKEPHFGITYGTNTFAHARTQVGYNFNALSTDPDGFYKNLSKTLNNTLIVDEIQSEWLQKGQTKGFVSDFEIIPGKNLLEYLDSNGIEYRISGKDSNTRDIEMQVQPGTWEDQPGFDPFKESMDYIFDKNKKSLRFIYDPEEETQYNTPNEFLINAYGIAPDFPIRESKKWVELVLNKMIEKASSEGRDSIAITNGQIQANRYDAMTDEDKEGLKKFYDTIVYDQLNKIAKEYGVKLETINMQNPDDIEGGSEKEELSITRRKVRSAQDEGYVLQKVPVEILQELTNNVSVPGHASFYSSTGKGSGADYILNNIDQEYKEAVGMGDVTTDYYIWSKEPITLDIQKIENLEEEFKKIVWELPIVPTKDASENEVVKSITSLSTLERDSIFKQFHIGGADTYPYDGENLNNIDLIQYTEYLQNYKPPEGVDLGYNKDAEQLIKMKLPKRLQKDSLSKPIKLSKAKKQTDKLFA